MKKIMILLIMIFMSFALTSCFRKDISGDFLLKPAAEEVNVKEFNNKSVEYKDFMKKIELFSARLTVETYKRSNKTQNLAISPISVYMALAMAIGSSNGTTKNEMLNAVGVTEQEVLDFTKYLYAYTNTTYLDDADKIAAISELSNSIWIDKDITLKEEGLDMLANSFNADSYYIPFFADNKTANEAFADYINKKSRGLIKKPATQLEETTLFVLVNTYYMKEIWNDYGKDLKFTKDKYDFTTSEDSVIKKLLLMSTYTIGKTYETDTYTHYYAQTEHGYRIKFIVPKTGYKLDEVFTVDNLVNINSISSYAKNWEEGYCYHTRVLFPSFEASYNNDLKPILQDNFNIKTLFTDNCDMSNLSDKEMYCSGVIHQTKLKVDESGIEGAAITYMPMKGTAAPAPMIDVYLDYIVDRAFGYLITDYNGTMLFSGVVNKI